MWLLADVEIAKIVFLSALVVTCGWLLVRTYRQPRRTARLAGSSRSLSREPRLPAAAAPMAAPPEIQRWETEARDLARSLSAQLDGKAGTLERLIRDAERQITRLEQLCEQAARLSSSESSPNLAPNHFVHQPETAMTGLRASPTAARAMSSAARRHEEIYALADSGLASELIAARIGSPVGEIDLILGLRQTRR
jgi:uncharacterized membrane protein YccC